MDVRVVKKEVVAAVLPMQEHWLPPSNLDLLLPPVDFGLFFCYRKGGAAGTSGGVLKKALAQALVTYYPFAGQVVPNSMGEPELLCNNRGVDFIEAVADVELQHLHFYNPDLSFEALLVPKNNPHHGVLTIQATVLKCGGIVVACTFDHRIADAFSANMFVVSWAQMARSHPSSLLPSFRRSLLSPRRPLRFDPCFDRMYMPVSSLPPPPKLNEHLSSRIYYVPAHQLTDLQDSLAVDGKRRPTKLESFSALLWKMMGEYQYDENKRKKQDVEGTMICRMGVVVDGRRGLSEAKGPVMGSYFGNVLSIPYGEKRVWELKERPLGWVAHHVHSFVGGAATEEHFLGLIDWVEGRRPDPACTRVYGTTMEEGPALVVSSGTRFPEAEVDFGWGRPALGSYHFPWGGQAGYVMPMPSPLRNGDWIVYMHLFQHHLDYIQTHAAHLFRPLTWAYLNTNSPSAT